MKERRSPRWLYIRWSVLGLAGGLIFLAALATQVVDTRQSRVEGYAVGLLLLVWILLMLVDIAFAVTGRRLGLVLPGWLVLSAVCAALMLTSARTRKQSEPPIHWHEEAMAYAFLGVMAVVIGLLLWQRRSTGSHGDVADQGDADLDAP